MATHADLITLAEQAGFESFDGESRFGPCPLCGEFILSIREATPGDPFLYCGRSYRDRNGGLVSCGFGAGTRALRSWVRKGWRVGKPIPGPRALGTGARP